MQSLSAMDQAPERIWLSCLKSMHSMCFSAERMTPELEIFVRYLLFYIKREQMRENTIKNNVCIDLNADLWHDSRMDSNTKRLLQGTFAISFFFLTLCLFVHFLLPAAPVSSDMPLPAFSSFTSFDDVTPD